MVTNALSKISKSNGTYGRDVPNKWMHLSEDEIKQEIGNIYNPECLPKNFRDWSWKEQDDYIVGKFQEMTSYPYYIAKLSVGLLHPIEISDLPVETPEWLDMEKFRRGQRFLLNHIFQISMALLVAFVGMFSFSRSLEPLVITGSTVTPYKSFLRFLRSVRSMRSTAATDPWVKDSESGKILAYARKFHVLVTRQCSQKTVEELNQVCNFKKPWSPARELLFKDFRDGIPEQPGAENAYISAYTLAPKPRGLTQLEMNMTLTAFVGYLVHSPEFFGVHNASEEDLDALCYMYRGIGYLLNIEDEYNFANGTAAEVKQRTDDIIQFLVKPSLRNHEPQWEHLSRCMIAGLNYYVPLIKFEPILLLYADYLKIPMTNFRQSVGYMDLIIYKFYKFMLHYLCKWQFVSWMFNKLFHYAIDRAAAYSPEKLAALEKRSNDTFIKASVVL